jgi:hypothetical protein
MSTPSEKVIMIFSKYINNIKAQSLLNRWCEELNICLREFSYKYLPQIILRTAKARDYFHSLNDVQFKRLLQELVILSNSKNQHISQKDIRIVKEQRNQTINKREGI